MKTTQELTLFGRYKNMINAFWNEGKRTYTSQDLNHFVGDYENKTWWKRGNNNPYYTTRLYQGLLRQFGCVSMIKRGLWQINGPVPSWFGSFHFKGLRGGYDAANKYADHNCIYWNNLPAEHKINPWKNIDPMRVMASIQPTTSAAPQQINLATAVTSQYIIKRVIPCASKEIQITFEVFVSPGVDVKNVADVAEITYEIIGSPKELSNEQVSGFVDILFGAGAFDALVDKLTEEVKSEAIAAAELAQTAVVTKPTDIAALLKDFAKHLADRLSEDIVHDVERMDTDDLVTVDFDTYNKSYCVDIESRSIADLIEEVCSDDCLLDEILKDYMKEKGL